MGRVKGYYRRQKHACIGVPEKEINRENIIVPGMENITGQKTAKGVKIFRQKNKHFQIM